MSLPTNLNPSSVAQRSILSWSIRSVLILAICAAIYQVLGPYWARVQMWNLIDNDDAMRVLQVRDWLAGQAWFDVSQHRLTPHPISNIHWSRFADLPLAMTMMITRATLGGELGEKAAVFVTPVWLGVVYVLVGVKASIALGGNKSMIPAVFLVAGAPAALAYFLPGRVDHHGLQLILLVTAIWGLVSSSQKMAGLSGAAIAIGIAIGLETLPMQLILIAWVALRWAWRGNDVATQTRWFATCLALGLALCFVATVPAEKWALPVNDAMGRGHVVLGILGGILLTAGSHLSKETKVDRMGLVIRLLILIGIGIVVLSGLFVFPELIVPPYSKLDPLLLRLWLNNVSEAKPLSDALLSTTMGFAVFPVIAGLISIVAIGWAKGKERDLWVLAAMTILMSVGLAIFWQARTSGLAAAVSGVMAGGLIGKISEFISLRAALMVALVLNPIVPGFLGASIARMFEPKSGKFKVGGGAGCYTQQAFATLNQQKPGLVIAPIDMGARILLTTRHQVLAAPYHRNETGNLASYRVFMAKSDQAKAMVAGLRGDYVAICTRSAEIAILSREGPGGLMADLSSNNIPDWLMPLPKAKGSDVRLFKVQLDENRIGG